MQDEQELTRDVVGEYVELKKRMKSDEERMRAIETVIFDNPVMQTDSRIKIVQGSTKYLITQAGYENLEVVGVKTTITETRRKDFDEFDTETQGLLLQNPLNVESKTSKASIRVR